MMACGVPVAAFPVAGPIDVVEHGRTRILDGDLAVAVRRALSLDPAQCVETPPPRAYPTSLGNGRGQERPRGIFAVVARWLFSELPFPEAPKSPLNPLTNMNYV